MNLFVWDFHGVLEKDNEKAVIEISNAVLKREGFTERFTEEDNEKYYGLKWYEYFERLLPDLPAEQHLRLQADCFTYAEQNLDILAKHIKPNDFAVKVLDTIKRAGHRQIVVSNSRQADLVWFLEAIGIKQFFAGKDIFGVNAHQRLGSKLEALRDYIKANGFEKIIVIGDSKEDMSLGRAVGSVTYFYKHPYRKHENTRHADHVIKDLRAILSEI